MTRWYESVVKTEQQYEREARAHRAMWGMLIATVVIVGLIVVLVEWAIP